MKRYLAILLIFILVTPAFALIPARKYSNMPQGIFKKNRSGTIIQYDKNGKKVGKYKYDGKNYIRIK